jgi:hypothetical protein
VLKSWLHDRTRRAASRLGWLISTTIATTGLIFVPSALGAAPESPTVEPPQPLFATTATFHGVLNPKNESPEGGTYQFLYKATKTATKAECESAGALKAPTSPGIYPTGEPEQRETEPVTGLTPNTQYVVCLSATSGAGETTVSAPEAFKTTTPAKPEAPEATTPQRGATTVVLFGLLNSGGYGEPGSYRFLYNQSATSCTGGSETPTKETSGEPEHDRVSAEVTGLTPGTQYTFCVEAFNALGESTTSAPMSFSTSVPPEAPENLEPTELTATSAKLRAIVDPHHTGAPGEAVRYIWLYAASATSCENEQAGNEEETTGERKEVTQTVTKGVEPGDTYTACLQVTNEAEESVLGPPITFTVLPIGEQSASDVNATSASVSARINPQGEPTGYHVEYVTDAQFQEHEWAGAARVPAADAPLPGADEPVTVRQTLAGLQPATLYHFRFRADNAKSSTGEDTTFTTSAAGVSGPTHGCPNAGLAGFSAALPDCRGYELVSSLRRRGSLRAVGTLGGVGTSHRTSVSRCRQRSGGRLCSRPRGKRRQRQRRHNLGKHVLGAPWGSG